MTVHPARAGQLDAAPRRVLRVSSTTDEVVVMGVENPLARQLWQCAGGFATFRDHFDTLHRTHSTRDHHGSFCIKSLQYSLSNEHLIQPFSKESFLGKYLEKMILEST